MRFCICAFQCRGAFGVKRPHQGSSVDLCNSHKGNWSLTEREGIQIQIERGFFWMYFHPGLALHSCVDQVVKKKQ